MMFCSMRTEYENNIKHHISWLITRIADEGIALNRHNIIHLTKWIAIRNAAKLPQKKRIAFFAFINCVLAEIDQQWPEEPTK